MTRRVSLDMALSLGLRKVNSFSICTRLLLLLICGSSILVQAEEICSQDTFLNQLACGANLADSTCDQAGTAGDPNANQLIYRNTANGDTVPIVLVGGPQKATYSAAACCAYCASLNNCDAWQYAPLIVGSGTYDNDCFITDSNACNYVTAVGSDYNQDLGPLLPPSFAGGRGGFTFGRGPNLAQGRCAGGNITDGSVATPPCKSLNLTASSLDCLVSIPAPSAVYGGNLAQLAPLRVSLNPLVFVDKTDPVTKLGVGSHPYTLTASNPIATSDACSGTITVVAGKPRPPSSPSISLTAATNCAATLPAASDVYNGPPLPESAFLTLAFDEGAVSSLKLGSHRFSLTITSSCGATSAPSTGSVFVSDREGLDPSRLSCPGVSTVTPSNPGTFTATYLGGASKANGCPVTVAVATKPGGGVLTCDRCNKAGQHTAPACKATVSGNNITIIDGGGLGNYMFWDLTANDGFASVMKTCGVCVENPNGMGGVCKAGWVPGTLAPCPGS